MKWLQIIMITLIGGLLLLVPVMVGTLKMGSQQESDILAYTFTDASNFERVIVIDTLTRVPLNMTPDRQSASRPVWSPDGEWLVFRSALTPQADTRYYVTRLDRSTYQWLNMPIDLTNFPVLYFEPKWLPDGQEIVFASHNSIGRLQYYRSDISSGTLTSLEEDDPAALFYEINTSALVSPDGLKSFLIEYDNPLLNLSIIEGNTTRLLYSFEGQRNTQFLLPRWASDSYHIAVSLWVDKVLQIFVLDTDSSPPRRITYAGGMNPVWRP